MAEHRQYEQLAERVVEQLQELWKAASGAGSADELEGMVRRCQRGMAAPVMETLCQQAVWVWRECRSPTAVIDA